VLASVYCILEHPDLGGSRVVVTDAPDASAHLGPGERAILVPRYRVPIPVPYEIWPHVVWRAEMEGKRHTNHHRFST
jgi:hypothetical protein